MSSKSPGVISAFSDWRRGLRVGRVRTLIWRGAKASEGSDKSAAHFRTPRQLSGKGSSRSSDVGPFLNDHVMGSVTFAPNLSQKLSPVFENLPQPVPGYRAPNSFESCELPMQRFFGADVAGFSLLQGPLRGASVISQLLLRRILAVCAVRWPSG